MTCFGPVDCAVLAIAWTLTVGFIIGVVAYVITGAIIWLMED